MYIMLLVRILLAGALTFAMLSVIYLHRGLAGQDHASGSRRRILWQFIYALILLTVFWPGKVYYPLDIPEWILTSRLFRLNENTFFSGFLNDRNIITGLKVWSFLYPAGAAFYLVISKRLLWENKLQGGAIRKFLTREERIKESRDFQIRAWEKYLANWRDRLNYYRKAELRYTKLIADNLGNIIYNRINSILYISSKEPPEDENSYDGAIILDRLHHPYIITILLNEISQILLWFVPGWWHSSKFLQRDIYKDRIERIEQKIKHKSDIRTSFLDNAAKIMLRILLGLILLLYVWQMPAVYLPDIEGASRRLPESDFGISRVLNASFRPADIKFNQMLINETVPIIEKYDNGIKIEKLAYDGSSRWQNYIDLPLPVLSNGEPDKIETTILIDSKILDSNEMALICDVSRNSGSSEKWYLLFDNSGNILDKFKLTKQSGFSNEKEQLYKITSDGEYLSYTPQMDNQDIEAEIRRYTNTGEIAHEFDNEDFTSRLEQRQESYPLLIADVAADNNGGIYVILTLRDPDYLHNNIEYYMCNMLYHINKAGDIRFIRDLSFSSSLAVISSAVDNENNIYIGGSTRFAANYLADELFRNSSNNKSALTSGSLIAISPEGNLLWQEIIPQIGNSYISEINLQDKTISLINNTVTDNSSPGENIADKYLWQLSTSGIVIGRYAIKDRKYIFIQPGEIYEQAPEDGQDGLEQ